MRELALGGLNTRVAGGTDGDGGGDGPVVVLLHGFGAPGTDLVPLWRQVRAPAGTRWVFPEGLIELSDISLFGDARAWWRIDIARLEAAMAAGKLRDLSGEEPEGLTEANAAINALLDAVESELNVPGSRIVLGGFSQGAMLSCDVALRSDRELSGLALMSGTLLARDIWLPRTAARAGTPVLISHGREDPLLPFALSEQLKDALSEAGWDVRWVPFNGGHGIAPSVLTDLGRLVEDAIA